MMYSIRFPCELVDVTNHTIRSDSCKTVKTTCHIGLPDHLRRGASIEYFPPVCQCWCWCAEPCDSIVGKKPYLLPTDWLDAFNNKVLKLASRACPPWSGSLSKVSLVGFGFFLFFFYGLVFRFIFYKSGSSQYFG